MLTRAVKLKWKAMRIHYVEFGWDVATVQRGVVERRCDLVWYAGL